MKWKYFPIPRDDHRATSKILEELAVAQRALANKVRARFSMGTGEVFGIEMENLDFESLETFSYATYGSGKSWSEATGMPTIPVGHGPIDGLISFLTDFLRSCDNGIVIMQNAVWKRSDPYWEDPARLAYCLPTRHVFYDNEVYHLITGQDMRRDLMEDTIREAWQHWLVGVCTTHEDIPDDNVLSEHCLCQLVEKTKHVFVSAFDEGGFLVWTPQNQNGDVKGTSKASEKSKVEKLS